MSTSSAWPLPPDPGLFIANENPSLINSIRIKAVLERLTLHVQGTLTDYKEFSNLCLSLARGIDYALANSDIPEQVQVLPLLMKQMVSMMCQRKNDELSHAFIMVLMISIKNACQIGWFQTKESEELITIADEIGKIYCSMENINAGPRSSVSTISTIMERFYPKLKLGRILVSIEAKPGYGAFAVDFHITKSNVLPDKIWLLVAQIDNTETSACLINPQQVNFLLNGKGVDKRNTVLMETNPQLPTNVTGMLKFGTNLLQAVGQFNGHYVILVTYMSAISLPEHPVIQDYVQPAVTSVDSDIIEGASQISLNCPISFSRINTPVKGRSCKHFQCFDFDNFVDINSRLPLWRCPCCNQCVCYEDIRLDRNMVEILRNVGKNIVEVIVLADGSWKAVLETDHDADKTQNKAHDGEKEQTEPQESSMSPSTVSNVLDLTTDNGHLETMDACETADRKPSQASVPSHFVNPNSTSLVMNSISVDQNVAAQTEDDFWSGVLIGCGRSNTPTVGVSEHPVLPDTLAFNQEAAGHDNNPAMNSAIQNQFSAPNDFPLQLNYNSPVNEYGRSSSIPRHINRTPVAVQALPVQSQALGTRPQQNSVTNLNSLLPSSSSAAPHVSLSNPASADAFNAMLSDTERHQHFSRSPLNLPQVSGANSSALQHHSATQNRVPPSNISASTQLQNSYRGPSLLSELRNPHLQQALSPRILPLIRSNNQRSHIQQGGSQARLVQAAGATATSQQARVMASTQVARQGSPQAGIFQTAGASANSQQTRVTAAQAARQSHSTSVQNQTSLAATSFTADSLRGLTAERRGSVGGTVQSVSRPDELFSSQTDQNWRPTARMRGSLAGRQYPDAVRQQIIAPTQPVQGSSSRPEGPQPIQISSSRPQGPQPVQSSSSRPQGPQPIHISSSKPLGPQSVQSSSPRPLGPQSVQSSSPRPQAPQPVRTASASSQLNVLIANNRNAHNSST